MVALFVPLPASGVRTGTHRPPQRSRTVPGWSALHAPDARAAQPAFYRARMEPIERSGTVYSESLAPMRARPNRAYTGCAGRNGAKKPE